MKTREPGVLIIMKIITKMETIKVLLSDEKIWWEDFLVTNFAQNGVRKLMICQIGNDFLTWLKYSDDFFCKNQC